MHSKNRCLVLGSLLLCATASMAGAELRMGNERFFGRGTRGPYTITRQNVTTRSEVIIKNGLRLQRDVDFLFDPALGMLSFMEPLRTSDVVEIQYEYDTDTVRAATATGGTMGILGSGSAGLALNYAFKPGAGGEQTLSALGFTGQAAVGRAAITSGFMMDRTAGSNAGTDAQNIQLGLKQDTGRLKLEGNFSRVGKKFSQADAMKLIKGSEAMSLTGSFQFGQNALLTATRVNNETPDAKTGVATKEDVTGATLAMNLAADTKFTATHSEELRSNAKGSTESAIDRLQLDQKLGKGSATLLQETVTTGKNGDSETTKATRLNVASKLGGNMDIESLLSVSDSSKSGDARDASVKLTRAEKDSKMILSVTDRKADAGDLRTHALSYETLQGGLKWLASHAGDSGSKGTHALSSLGVEGAASKRMSFTAGLGLHNGDKSGMGTSLSLKANPSAGLNLSASRSEESTNQTDISSTRLNMDLLTAGNKVKITGNYAEDLNKDVEKGSSGLNIEANPTSALKFVAGMSNKLDEKGEFQTQTVGLEAKPTGALQFAASYADLLDPKGTTETSRLSVAATGGSGLKVSAALVDSMTPTGASDIREATMSVAPIKDRLSLSSSYREEVKGEAQFQVAMLAAEIRPLNVLHLAGSMKQREGTTDEPDTMNASVTVKPLQGIQIAGSYSSNPEEKDQILRLVRRGLSLTSTLGALSLTGGYLQEQSLLDDAEGTRAQFKLGLKFNKQAELQGGFEQTVGAVRGYKPTLAYNVKYTHNAGQVFNLLLDANVVQRDGTGPVSERQEVKATANLGIRF